jgi:hypothetical protein
MGTSASNGGSTLGNIGAAAGIGGNFLNVASGLQRGGVAGDTGAALSAIKGANSVDQLATGSGFLSSGASGALGAAGGALGIYNGLQQGGVRGDLSAAIGAAQLYAGASSALAASGATSGALAGAGAASSLGAVAAPIAFYGALYDLFSKQSTVSPLSAYETTMGNANAYIGQGKAILASGASQQQDQYAQGDINFGESLEPIAQRQLEGLNPLTGGTDQFAPPPEISPTTNFAWATPSASMSLGARHNIQQS